MSGNDVSVSAAALAEEHDGNDPVTFHRVMQSMIGDGLKARYVPPKKLSHELFVLMLQLKDREQRAKTAKPRKVKARTAKSSKAGPPSPVAASL